MELIFEDFTKVLIAIVIGGVIGFEREFHDKAAGFRTLMFICLGATLFTILSLKLALTGDGDPTRIAADIVTGVGFIGAGVILREGGRVVGLTTAATVWLVAALGMAIGAGEHLLVLVVAALAIVVLWALPAFEGWIDHLYNERSYEVVTSNDYVESIETLFRDHGLRVAGRRQAKAGARITRGWKVAGRLASQEAVTARLLADPKIEELRF